MFMDTPESSWVLDRRVWTVDLDMTSVVRRRCLAAVALAIMLVGIFVPWHTLGTVLI